MSRIPLILVTDYNIYRDYHYKLTVNIAGPNSADLRVTITNGNVAVFDDVDNVENTVNFGDRLQYLSGLSL